MRCRGLLTSLKQHNLQKNTEGVVKEEVMASRRKEQIISDLVARRNEIIAEMDRTPPFCQPKKLRDLQVRASVLAEAIGTVEKIFCESSG